MTGRPVFVVIPVLDQIALTDALLCDLRAQGGYERIFVFDNGSIDHDARWLRAQAGPDLEVIAADGWRLYRMWNEGVRRAREVDTHCDVAILNNDLRLGPSFLSALSTALAAEPMRWAVCPNYDARSIGAVAPITGTRKTDGFAGFAFMARGEAFDHVVFDEGFEWWFGDDDFVAQIEQHGAHVAMVGTTSVEHVNGGSQTMLTKVPDIYPALINDHDRMVAKWSRV